MKHTVRRTGYFYALRGFFTTAAHLHKKIQKLYVTLAGVGMHTPDDHFTSGNGGSRIKVTGSRYVRFDFVIPGFISCSGCYDKCVIFKNDLII